MRDHHLHLLVHAGHYMRVRCMYAFCWWSRLRHHDVRPKGLMGRRKGERTPRSEPREGRHVLEAEEAPAVHLCFKVKHPAHLSEQQLGHHHQHQGWYRRSWNTSPLRTPQPPRRLTQLRNRSYQQPVTPNPSTTHQPSKPATTTTTTIN